MFRQPAWLCLHLASCVATQQNATFLGLLTLAGNYDPKFELAEIFVRCIYPQVSSSYVYTFGSYRVHAQTQTHKQTDSGENIQRSLLCYDVG